ncbi:hypothetical protein ACFL2Y_00700 [Candidatus Omnitrophota bacterium]
MRDEKIKKSPDDLSARSTSIRSIERVDPSEIDTVARVLSTAYAEYPVHTWIMPKTTRLDDAKIFFTFYLRWLQPRSWDVFATADRSAVIVTRPVRYGDSKYPEGLRYLPTLIRAKSPVNEFFQWVENFRPKIDHQYFEFLAALPNAHRGTGFFLLASVLEIFDRESIPVWTWTANSHILPFFRRQGFEIGTELHRDDSTPPVIPLWRQPAPLKEEDKSI